MDAQVPKKYKELVQLLVEKAQGKLKFAAIKKGAVRLNKVKPTISLTAEEIHTTFSQAGLILLESLDKTHPEACSSKFTTYKIQAADLQVHKVVIANGGNNGHILEHRIADQLQKDIELHQQPNNLLLKELDCYGAISISPYSCLYPVQIVKSAGAPPKRPISLDLVDVGATIADLTLVLQNGEKAYLSLKNKQGNTFSNNGIVGTFTKDEFGRIIPIASKADSIFNAFGIDKYKIAEGCSSYEAKTFYSKEIDYQPSWNYDQCLTYIRSGFGFGYWYVREKALDKYQIINLTTLNHLQNYVSTIEMKHISYPFYHTDKDQSKQCSVDLKVITKDAVEYPMNLRVEIRNTKGAIIPIELKILKK